MRRYRGGRRRDHLLHLTHLARYVRQGESDDVRRYERTIAIRGGAMYRWYSGEGGYRAERLLNVQIDYTLTAIGTRWSRRGTRRRRGGPSIEPPVADKDYAEKNYYASEYN